MNKKFRLFLVFCLFFVTSFLVSQTEDLTQKGQYTVKMYTDSVYTYDEEYFAKNTPAKIYYPDTTEKMPAVIMIHGWNGNYEGFVDFAEHFASYGTIVLLYTAYDQKKPFEWLDGLTATYQMLIAENTRSESPLFNKIDTQRMGLIGHSMGGSGVLNVAARDVPFGLRKKIKTVVGLNPYNGGPGLIDAVGGGNIELKADVSRIVVPTLIITGSSDGVATPWLSYKFYESLKHKKRVFYTVSGMGHTDWYGSSANLGYKNIMKQVVTAWLLVVLHENSAYNSYFMDKSGSAFEHKIKSSLKTTPEPVLTPAGPVPEYPAYKIK